MKLPVSVAIITFNEENKIEDCLKSVWWADEKLVVDSHSKDATRDIAERFGANIVERDWAGYINQKNFALELCRNDWVLCLDADERVSKELYEEIKSVLNSGTADGYSMPRKVFYINRWIKHCGWYPAPKVRLVKKDKARWGGVDPHDRLFVEGKTEKLKGDIYHLSFDSIYDHLKTIDNFTRVGAEEAFKNGKRANLLDITARPLFTFIKMYFIKLGFLDGVAGLIVCLLSSFHTYTKYQRLYKLQ